VSVEHDSRVHTVTITNRGERVDCFFYTQYIPTTNSVATSNIRVDNQYTTDFLLENDGDSQIYSGHTTYRWVFGVPDYDDPEEHCQGIRLRTGQTATINYMTEQPMDRAYHMFTGWAGEGFFGYN
jgi:hypothetical protein